MTISTDGKLEMIIFENILTCEAQLFAGNY